MGWAARAKSQRVCPECNGRTPVLVPVTLRVDGSVDAVCPRCESEWIQAAYLWPRPERAADEGLLRHRLPKDEAAGS
jgi:hypothetical protein